MKDAKGRMRVKWVGDGSLYVECNRTDERLYITKAELLSLIELAHDFVIAYNEDFISVRNADLNNKT